MPSGAKKRKAAKKRKEQNTHIDSSSINNTDPQGNDDPKSQDERDSDGGEVHSPASQDHDNQEHPFNEENEELEKRDHSLFISEYKPLLGLTSDAQASEEGQIEDENVINIGREMNSEQYSESNYVSLKQVESSKESHNGDDNNSSSSSSSSDDESHSLDKKWKEEAYVSILAEALSQKKASSEETAQYSGTEKANGNSTAETDSSNDFATLQVPISEVVQRVMEGAQFGDPAIMNVIEPGLKNNEDKLLPKSNDVFADLVPEKDEDKALPILDENVEVSTTVVMSDVTRNEGKILGAHSTETTVSAEKNKDLEAVGGTTTVIEGKVPKSSVYSSEASKGTVKARDSETSEYAETEPLVPPAPQVTQRTSWMNCCGLFDLFTGSNR